MAERVLYMSACARDLTRAPASSPPPRTHSEGYSARATNSLGSSGCSGALNTSAVACGRHRNRARDRERASDSSRAVRSCNTPDDLREAKKADAAAAAPPASPGKGGESWGDLAASLVCGRLSRGVEPSAARRVFIHPRATQRWSIYWVAGATLGWHSSNTGVGVMRNSWAFNCPQPQRARQQAPSG